MKIWVRTQVEDGKDNGKVENIFNDDDMDDDLSDNGVDKEAKHNENGKHVG